MLIFGIWLGTVVLLGILCIAGVVGRARRGAKIASGPHLLIIPAILAGPYASLITRQRVGDPIDERVFIYGILINVGAMIATHFDPWNFLSMEHDPESRWGRYVAKNPPTWPLLLLLVVFLAAAYCSEYLYD
ncbi:hypothetical protein BJH93_00950 [Kocuria polaris]|nr:hypothetical protein [Kocuria polaris]